MDVARPLAVNPHQRIPALDALRGLAVIAVAFYHFGGGLAGPGASGKPVLPAIHIGARGVTLFFVLSGFLITRVLWQARGDRHFFRNFFARRGLRIFPLYYLVLLVCLVIWPAVVGRITWQGAGAENGMWLWWYGQNFLMGWRGDWCFGPFDHCWSLAVEEQFYLVWPFVVWGLNRTQIKRFCWGMFLVCVAGRLLWTVTGGNDVARYVLPWFRMDSLAAGAWVAIVAEEQGSWRQLVGRARITLVTMALAIGVFVGLGWRYAPLNDTLWTLACGALLVVMTSAQPQSWWERFSTQPVLQWFGKYSYAIYLFGNLLVWIVAPLVTAKGVGDWLGNAWLGQWAYLALMLSLTSLLAVASWYSFEAPFLRLKRYFEVQPATTSFEEPFVAEPTGETVHRLDGAQRVRVGRLVEADSSVASETA